ncbi:MAG: hypothetical protein WC465_04380 [Patescibacteria group bacterium]
MTTINKFIYWAPRILAILFILFLALFSFDVIGMQAGFWPTILGLLMHNIPSFILLVVLLISWKHEIVGFIAFMLAGFVYIIMLTMNQFEWYMPSWALTISGPAWLTGILFYINWSKKKKAKI